MSASMPENAADWPFEARVTALAQHNTSVDIRKEIDNIIGLSNPRWDASNSDSGHFNKEELSLLLLALGGPQEAGR